MRNPAFNKEQWEGLARVSDNIAMASVIAVLLGGFVDQKVTIYSGPQNPDNSLSYALS